MASLGEKFTKAYTTFSGIDITAIFDDKTVLTVSGVSCSITREKAPVYTFGSATPRSISRGKRGIAGSIVATLFDRHSMMELFLDPRKWYYAHRNEVNWLRNPTNAAAPLRASAAVNTATLQASRTGDFGRATTAAPGGFGSQFSALSPDVTAGGGTAQSNISNVAGTGNAAAATAEADFATFNQQTTTAGTIPPGAIVDGQATTVRRSAVYADQLLPFDLTLVAQNEYGQAAWCSINACEFINEGMGMSVDDITSEQQFTFIAIHVEPWRPLDPIGKELQNVGAQTSFGISDGTIQVDSDAGPISPAWAPFYARDIDGSLKTATGAPVQTGTAANPGATGTQGNIITDTGQGFFPTV